MYYNEKWENGIFYIKTCPFAAWKQKTPTLADIYEAIKTEKLSIHQALDLAYQLGYNNAQLKLNDTTIF